MPYKSCKFYQKFDNHKCNNYIRDKRCRAWNITNLTWFVQLMMNELYSLTGEGEVCTADVIDTAKRNIIQVQEYSYLEVLSNLSLKQKQMMQALAKEGRVTGITSAEFITRHRLGSASSVQSAIAQLVEKDIITKTGDSYRIYDYFFAEWIRENF